uniref:Uncharacterized protein n=1 Tax=Mycobacterium riyadhense TaxID=486698 RepID=A0A653F2Q0_9MYCO|nr:hypothetical protein BIN_B_05281 [Mycobacterium riyadhense]
MITPAQVSLQAAASHSTVVAVGASVVNMSHEVLYILLAVAGTYFLGSGVARGMKEHWKRGTGAAVSALAGGVVLAVVVAHIVGIYQRGNQEFEQLPGGVGKPGISGNRGW